MLSSHTPSPSNCHTSMLLRSPSPSPENYVCPFPLSPQFIAVITDNHSTELILLPSLTGINRKRFLTLFHENIQVLCASSSCSHTDHVKESGHRCRCCALRYHGSGTCNLGPFSDVVTVEGFSPGMLFWYCQRMYFKYQHNLDSCSLMVCDYCINRINTEIAGDMIQYSDDDGEASPSKKTKTTPASSQEGDACDCHLFGLDGSVISCHSKL